MPDLYFVLVKKIKNTTLNPVLQLFKSFLNVEIAPTDILSLMHRAVVYSGLSLSAGWFISPVRINCFLQHRLFIESSTTGNMFILHQLSSKYFKLSKL